ncbi:LuxR C-terminal-related transcriptional regulator [Ferrimicrobium sp.]|uniref:LuxR C-terminal-related transcriptional regulator n=1 Tax=Ferrimicrobium sp. TaxID=2926050 RepID=UPI00262BA7FD|nr:LuxR C-terminal-related transcriptional regulator [Ferrimicrobium sp.]
MGVAKALLIEEDDLIARGMAGMLEDLGWEVPIRVRALCEVSRSSLERTPLVIVGLTPQNADIVSSLAHGNHQVVVYSSSVGSRHIGDAIGAGALGYVERHSLDQEELTRQLHLASQGVRCVSRGLARRLLVDMESRPLLPSIEIDNTARAYLQRWSDQGCIGVAGQRQWEEAGVIQGIWNTWAKRTQTYRLKLTDRQVEILAALDRGLSAGEIAEMLFVSVATVRADQDRVKERVADIIGTELKRDTACRRAWHLMHGMWHTEYEVRDHSGQGTSGLPGDTRALS